MSRTVATIVAGTLFAAAIVGWPVITEGTSLPLSAFACLAMWVWLLAIVGIGAVPRSYHWPVAALAIALSFGSPLLSLYAIGIPFAQVAGPWLAIALAFSVLCIVIFRKARSR